MATQKAAQITAVKSHIKQGYVLHIDPDYLLLTYGDITTGKMPKHTIGPRYALCIGVEGDATFWTLLTCQDNEHKEPIPEKAKEGPWADNGLKSFFSKDQLWVMTKDMAVEAHFQANQIRSTFKHNFVKVNQIAHWPDLPVVYPKNFTPIDRMAKPTIPRLASTSPVPQAITLMHELAGSSALKPAEVLNPTPNPEAVVAALTEPTDVAAIDREAVIEKAIARLRSPRLTDAEVQQLAADLEQAVINTLLS